MGPWTVPSSLRRQRSQFSRRKRCLDEETEKLRRPGVLIKRKNVFSPSLGLWPSSGSVREVRAAVPESWLTLYSGI